jgi:outer membrane murein-binding lipoprotein Lpp
MDGIMKKTILAFVLTLISLGGCAGRMNSDLLQARIRDQAAQLTASQQETSKIKAELKQSRHETERLKAELAQQKFGLDEIQSATATIDRLHIYGMSSGGLNKDGRPGDDAVVVQFAPLDEDGDAIKAAGDVEITLIDPQLPGANSKIGTWKFSADDCASHWTRGIASTGFQFTLPLDQTPQNGNLVLQLKMRTANDQLLNASHAMKIVPGGAVGIAHVKRPRPNAVKVVNLDDEILPPVGDHETTDSSSESDDWADARSKDHPETVILHSANWTEATIPRFR